MRFLRPWIVAPLVLVLVALSVVTSASPNADREQRARDPRAGDRIEAAEAIP